MKPSRTFAVVMVLAALVVHCGWAGEDDSIAGVWKVAAYDQNGHAPPADILGKMRVVVRGDKMVLKPKLIAQYTSTFGKVEALFSLDESRSDEIKFTLDKANGWIDLTLMGETKSIKGLYAREGDAVRICFPQSNKKRPKKMPEEPKAGMVRMVLKPVKE